MASRDSVHDFDFLVGTWTVQHHRLRERLTGCAEWDDFAGTSTTRPILGGAGNIEDNVLHLPDGAYRAAALRSFDPEQRTWAIWWLDARAPHALDVPVVGRFVDGLGEFTAQDVLGDTPITVRFRWIVEDADAPRWEQAFSPDDGATWETNWTMEFERA